MNAVTQQVDHAVKEGLDSQGVVERRLTYLTDQQATKSAWLTYINSRNQYPEAYKKHFRSKKKFIEDSEYWVPLGKVRSVPKNQTVRQAELELIPVFPVLFQTYDGTDLTELDKGFMYIFVDGYLWREIYCDAAVQCFRDINLTMYQGHDERPYNAVEFERYFVLLPKRMNNKPCKVEIAYSEVQWSWDYIVKLGGMDKNDPRYYADALLSKDNELIKLGEYEARIKKDNELRAKRCQEIKLDQYTPTTTNPDIARDISLMPAKLAHALNNQPTGEEGYEYPRIYHLTDDIVQSDLPVLTLKHPIKQARDLAAAHTMARSLLELLVDEMSGVMREEDKEYAKENPQWKVQRERIASEFQLAVFVNQYFYQAIEAGKDNSQLSKEARKVLHERETTRDEYLDDADFKQYLHDKDIKILIDKIHQTKQALIDFLKIEEDIHCFTYAMYDFFSLNDGRYIKGFELFNDLLLGVKDHPASQVQMLRQEISEWDKYAEKDEGQDFLLTLLGVHPDKPPHKACECLFPKQKGGDWDDLFAYDADSKLPKGDFRFNLEKFAALYDSSDSMESTSEGQPIRRVAQLINNLGTRFAEASFHRSEDIRKTFDQKRVEAKAAYNNEEQKLAKAEADLDFAKAQNDNSERIVVESKQRIAQAEIDLQQAKQKQLSDVEIEQKQRYLQQLQTQLQSHQLAQQANREKLSAAYEAQGKQLQIFQDALAELRKIGVDNPHLTFELTGFARFHHARGNYLLPIFRMHHVAKTIAITQIEITITDYFNGRFPRGTVPFNIFERTQSAQMVKEALERYNTVKGAKGYIERPGKTGIYTFIDDLLHMRGELATIMQMTDAANAEVNHQIEQKIKVLAYELTEAEAANIEQYRADSELFDAGEQKARHSESVKFWSPIVAERQGKIEQHKKLSKQFEHTMRQCEAMANHPVPDLLNPKGMASVGASTAIIGTAMWFELNNLRYAWTHVWHDYKNVANILNFASGLLDAAAVVTGAIDTIATYRYGQLTTKQLKLLNQQKHLIKMGVITELSPELKNIKFRAHVLRNALGVSLFANILSAGMAGYEIFKAARRGDAGAVIGNAIMLSGFALMATNDGIAFSAYLRGAVKNPMGRAGWIGFALVLVGAGVVYFFSLKPLEAWLAHCSWGKLRLGKLNKEPGFGEQINELVTSPTVYKSWYDHPEYAYLDLLNIVMQPGIKLEKLPAPSQSQGNDWQQRIKMTVFLPGYNLGNGYVDIKLQVKNPRTFRYEAFDMLTDADLNDGLKAKKENSVSKIWQQAHYEKDEANQS